MNIGMRLKQLRKNRGYTLEILAELLNKKYPGELSFNKGLLSKWENGRTEPRLSSVRMLADFYNISIDELNPQYTPDTTPNTPDPSWKPILTAKDERNIQEKLEEIKLGIGDGANAAHDGLGLQEYSEETQKAVLNGIEQLLHMMALERKAKFTPNKYKQVKGEE